MSFTLAIIGRPNTGKSTLFNRLVGKRLALVDDRPGVTRDLREGEGRLGELRFRVIDTAGLEEATDDSLPGRMRRLTERAMAEADLCLFLIDARAGVLALDRTLAEMLRKSGARVILAANKCEGRASEAGLYEAFELGLGDPVAVSAEHGEGMGDLYSAILPYAEALAPPEDAADSAPIPGADDDPLAERRPLQIAITGRPNAGKSTLINTIIGDERLLTGPEAGLTRDAIALDADWGGRAVRIFDTAGLRKKAKVQETLDRLSSADALRAIRFAEVVVVLMDAAQAFETQDLRIADLAEREGRAVILAVNKWDAVADKQAERRRLTEMGERLLPQLRGVPLVTLSGLTGRGLDRLRDAVEAQHRIWNKRVTTAKLNDWLAAKLAEHPPPAPGGRRIRLRFMTQVRTRPPGFVVFCSRPEALPESYTRYLVNGLRADFGLGGVPLRLHLRKGENPYAKD
ncbi:ribosome biogenesis GTPase Der [Paralimibaculum aggregatum]|uniref:GTPase Der n=1 Tax=Paralimibaculum aggregatum TaxID=3036245 RepID=A0ABQ6LP55_9RHOB|nr:ribosome biogenesis GTPase Der [Limibaculum sp. NKW23]GMG84251.1 ribosome biogenesis GTPase Der [Limibaculum sp. NKW23]